MALLEKRAIELHISGFDPADIHVPKPVSVHATDVRSVPVESLHVTGTPHAVSGRVPAGELPVDSMIGVRPKLAPSEVTAAKPAPVAPVVPASSVPGAPVKAEAGHLPPRAPKPVTQGVGEWQDTHKPLDPGKKTVIRPSEVRDVATPNGQQPKVTVTAAEVAAKPLPDLPPADVNPFGAARDAKPWQAPPEPPVDLGHPAFDNAGLARRAGGWVDNNIIGNVPADPNAAPRTWWQTARRVPGQLLENAPNLGIWLAARGQRVALDAMGNKLPGWAGWLPKAIGRTGEYGWKSNRAGELACLLGLRPQGGPLAGSEAEGQAVQGLQQLRDAERPDGL